MEFMTGSHGQHGIIINGRLVGLGPARRDLLPLYQRWSSDLETARTLSGDLRPKSPEQAADWYTSSSDDPHTRRFTIYELTGGRPIGNAYLREIDAADGTAEYTIVIGEAECRGRGYGTEATRLVLDIAFTTLGLRSVLLHVYEYNRAGIRAYERGDFRECGRRRQNHRLAGRAWDTIIMECRADQQAPA